MGSVLVQATGGDRLVIINRTKNGDSIRNEVYLPLSHAR